MQETLGVSQYPCNKPARQGNVIIWSGEDDADDTLVPRLGASGADRSRVHFAKTASKGLVSRAFDPAQDIPALQAAIERVGGASLIIIDPIVSATKADSHKNGETRRGLQPLVELSANLGAALVGITHFSKGTQGGSPIDRVTGSVAFGALARVVMVTAFGQTGEDGKPGPRAFMRAKSNIGPDRGGFHYELRDTPMPSHLSLSASVVRWGDSIKESASEVLAKAEAVPRGKEPTQLREAIEWLKDYLAEGPKPQKEAKRDAAADGYSFRTLERAKATLKITSVKLAGVWVWTLPKFNPANDSRLGFVGGVGVLPSTDIAFLEILEKGRPPTEPTPPTAQGEECLAVLKSDSAQGPLSRVITVKPNADSRSGRKKGARAKVSGSALAPVTSPVREVEVESPGPLPSLAQPSPIPEPVPSINVDLVEAGAGLPATDDEILAAMGVDYSDRNTWPRYGVDAQYWAFEEIHMRRKAAAQREAKAATQH